MSLKWKLLILQKKLVRVSMKGILSNPTNSEIRFIEN